MHGAAVARFIVGQRRIEVVEQPLPARLHLRHMCQCVVGALAQQFAAGQVGAHLIHRQAALQIGQERIAQGELVFNRQFDVDAFDAV